MNVEISKKIESIEDLEEEVRRHINTTRYQKDLIKNNDSCNQICSSLDTIGDTLYSISAYVESEYPQSGGLKYIFTYGLLQALYVQQDAISHLSEAFGIEYKRSEKLKNIRALRNAAVGHPTKQEVGMPKGQVGYNYISRITLSYEGFTLVRSYSQKETEYIDIKLLPIIKDQLDEITSAYKKISSLLKEVDKVHKEKHKDMLLIDIFHSSMGYAFEKIAQGIYSSDSRNREFGLSMIGIVKETYQRFQQALQDRGDVDESIKHDLDQYNHALSKLELYLGDSNHSLCKYDASIYIFYIRNKNKDFEEIAKEIDDRYRG